MTFEQIKELIELVAERRLDGVKIDRSGFILEIRGQQAPPVAPMASAAAPPPAAALAGAPAPMVAAPTPTATGGQEFGEAEASELPPDTHILTSPIVGTFYRAPSPDSESYAEVGNRVSQGEHLCIVEAMKVMNEIESDVAGVIVQIFPQNAQPVEFGEPLFAIRTS